jgi:hypothetical protein
MPKGQPRAGAIWADSPGLAHAQRRAQELIGPIAVAREARMSNVKHCEVGYPDMTATIPPWPRPLIVLGSGSTWFAAFAAAERALADPAVRAEVERHDELLAQIVAQRHAERLARGQAGGPAEDA